MTDRSGISFNGEGFRRTISEDLPNSASFKNENSQTEHEILISDPVLLTINQESAEEVDQDSLLNFEIERRTVSENVLGKPDFSHKNNAQVKQSVWSDFDNP